MVLLQLKSICCDTPSLSHPCYSLWCQHKSLFSNNDIILPFLTAAVWRVLLLLLFTIFPSDDCSSPSQFIAIKSFTLWINIIYYPFPNGPMSYSQYSLLKGRLLLFLCICSLYMLWFYREPKDWGFWMWSSHISSATRNNLDILIMNTLTVHTFMLLRIYTKDRNNQILLFSWWLTKCTSANMT